MEWKDATKYSKGQRDRTPTTFSARCGPLTLTVTNEHIHYRGQWIAHAWPIFDTKQLKAQTCAEAQDEVVQLARGWLSAANNALA